MIVKAGLVRQHHFAHAGRLASVYQSFPENPSLRDAKRRLATRLRGWIYEYVNATTITVYNILASKEKYITDLLITFHGLVYLLMRCN
jgi:competence CoiA-like predicted nuclease